MEDEFVLDVGVFDPGRPDVWGTIVENDVGGSGERVEYLII